MQRTFRNRGGRPWWYWRRLSNRVARISGDNLPAVRTRQVASNVRPPGFDNSANSNGTDTTANFVTAHWNESGKALTELATVDCGFRLDATNEVDLTDDFTITRAITYPFNTTVVAVMTWSGATSKTIVAGSLVNQSDWMPLSTPIPADAKFGVHTFISVASGKRYPTCGIGSNGGLGERKETGTGLTDKTQSLGVPNALSGNVYRPAAILARGTDLRNSAVGLGDSIMAGATDGLLGARGGTGMFGRAAEGVIPFMHIAVTGTTAENQITEGKLSRRAALVAACGITHVVTEWCFNDNASARTDTQIMGYLASVWAAFNIPNVNGETMKVVQTTMTNKSSSTDGWRTLASQTGAAGYTGAGSKRALINAAITAKPAPLFDVIPVGTSMEPTPYDGRFAVGSAFSIHLKDPSNGTVSSGATTTVIPTSLTGTSNAWQFGFIKWTSGALSGTTSSVTSSTNGTLNLTTAVASAPAAGDTFTIYPNGSAQTTDGTHPSNTGTAAPGYGGIYIARDVIIPYFQSYAIPSQSGNGSLI